MLPQKRVLQAMFGLHGCSKFFAQVSRICALNQLGSAAWPLSTDL
jgi:hypothetical protein